MLEELHVATANFRTALDKFWRKYIADISYSDIAKMDAARSIFRHYEAILDQVLDLQGQARRIEGILGEQPIRSLNEQED